MCFKENCNKTICRNKIILLIIILCFSSTTHINYLISILYSTSFLFNCYERSYLSYLNKFSASRKYFTKWDYILISLSTDNVKGINFNGIKDKIKNKSLKKIEGFFFNFGTISLIIHADFMVSLVYMVFQDYFKCLITRLLYEKLP